MKFLIVNGDDFGASRGINRGILEAHERGILTSTSLLVRTPWSEEAAQLSRATPDLSVGLHVDLGKELKVTTGSRRWMHEELHQQFARFQELMHRRPTHLDSHHNVHRDPQALSLFLELAAEHGLPCANSRPFATSRNFTANGVARRTLSSSASKVSPGCWRRRSMRASTN